MRTVLCIAGVVAQLALIAPPAAADDGALYHRFTIAPRLEWGTVSIELVAQHWRAGSPDGPPASESQLRAVLANLSAIEIGARCAGWVDGRTLYPCGFALEALDMAGRAADYTIHSLNWDAPPEETLRPEALAAHRAGLLAPVLGPMRFVAAQAPLPFLGDQREAAGGRIAFRMRAVSNALVPSEFDRASGAVILRPGKRTGNDV